VTLSNYPQAFGDDQAIINLRHALERIHRTASDWRKDAHKSDGRTTLVSINRSAKTALKAATNTLP